MSKQQAETVVLKMDQTVRWSDLLSARSKRALSVLGNRRSIVAIVVALLAAVGGWFETKAYAGSRMSKPIAAIAIKMERPAGSQARATRVSESILLLLASASCLMGVVVRKKRKVQTSQERMAAALSHALESRVLQPVTPASRREFARAAHPQVHRGMLTVSAATMAAKPRGHAEPTSELKCFVPVVPSNTGQLSLGDEIADNLREVALLPEAPHAVPLSSVSVEQASLPARPVVDRTRFSSELKEIIADFNKSRTARAMAQERIRQTNTRIRNSRSRAVISFDASALVA